jgi:uncharacterized protein
MKSTVIYHSADYDGLFCREIAKKFLPPDTEFIGWDFTDAPLDHTLLSREGVLYILDLPVDKPFGLEFKNGWICANGEQVQPIDRWKDDNLVWIDHHKSSIQSHPSGIPGYRIDGVAACRLVWQWFSLHAEWDPREQHPPYDLPSLLDYVDRRVTEPLAVRLAGEYDIWDKRDSRAELFQYGLDTEIDHNPDMFIWLLELSAGQEHSYTTQIVAQGKCAATCINKRDSDMMKSRSFKTKFEGMTFLALNIARCNSLTFASLDKPETGHDALMGFYWNGKTWTVSLYHAKHNTGIDLSDIAKKYGGGGHRGACGFTFPDPQFINAFTLCS